MSGKSSSVSDAVRLLQAGHLPQAAQFCHGILKQQPGNVDAMGLLGVIAATQGNASVAVDWFDKAIAAAPNASMLYLHRGNARRALGGREADAVADFRQALRLDPKLAEAHHQLGNALKKLGQYSDAVPCLREATRLAPENAIAWLNLGVAQMELGRNEEAIAAFERATSLSPGMAEAHNVLGAALTNAGRVGDALAEFQHAIELRPNYAAARNNRARALKTQGLLAEAVAEYRACVAAAPDPANHSNLVYALNFVPDCTPDQIFAEHVAWARRYAEPLAPRAGSGAGLESPGDVSAKRRLRIGFVSPDLVNHAVAYFFEPLLAELDRTRFEVVCYSDAAVPDRVTERLRRLSDQWRDTSTATDEQLAAAIRRDGIDILVDLTGHTAKNRLLVFARKPSPVQITWLGYPNTTGLRQIDYRITDGVSDPMGEAERWHTEALLRLPRAFLCFQPPADAPEVSPLPVLSRGSITFGSFSNYAKISDPCAELWARVLKAVPGSVLVLKSRGLGDAATAALARRRFEHHGIAGERIVLDPKLVGTADHLRLYHGIDIALDPFPYNGTTTTCEALWMGVPVVTLAGRTHVARVGASLLTHLGAAECVASRADEYVAIAAGLARDTARLADLRAGLRSRMARSPLCDAPGFAREFAEAMRDIWHRRQPAGG